MFILNSTTYSAAALQHDVEEMRRNSLKVVQDAPADDDSSSFAKKLKAAVKQRLGASRPRTAASVSSDESFASKLAREVKRKLGSRSQQAARECAAKEKARYRKPQRRAHSKSD